MHANRDVDALPDVSIGRALDLSIGRCSSCLQPVAGRSQEMESWCQWHISQCYDNVVSCVGESSDGRPVAWDFMSVC